MTEVKMGGVTPNATEELDALIARVALADRRAFDQLYTLTCARLFAVAMRMMKNRAEAEDVLQDAYVRIWQRAGSFRPGEGRSMPWLITITRNLAIDRMRVRAAPIAPMEMAQDVPDDGPTPETALAQSENRARIDACLEELEARRAEAVRAAYLDGWSYQELADRFDTPSTRYAHGCAAVCCACAPVWSSHRNDRSNDT
ncbi:sigma-70 family RNA polymerase sigma factor [Tateyamaria armeniaca]|uniref:RNA polymerase sigma factor n=1 Tax=Tateyamaria armeniaca TaxID=2518930 RepID=A0ABW8UTQ4_9RHOB